MRQRRVPPPKRPFRVSAQVYGSVRVVEVRATSEASARIKGAREIGNLTGAMVQPFETTVTEK